METFEHCLVCAPRRVRKDPVLEVQVDSWTDVQKRVANEWLTVGSEKLEPKMRSTQ